MNKRKILALLLGLCMIISLLPSVALATGPGEEAAASYPVYVHGGTLQKDGMTVRSGAEFPAGTVLTVTLDESQFSGHTFAYWLGSDGTQVPQKSFRLLVDRLTAFYPVFSDLTGNFGDWKVLEKGKLCTDGTLYVREDSAQGLKEYRFERGYHNTYTYEPLNGEQHTMRCADCPYTNVNTHGWNSGVVTTEATCAAEGVKTYTCKQCGETKTEAIEKTSHSYPYYPEDSDYEIITPADGSAPGKRALKCSVCGQPGTEREYITAKLPNKSGVQHYKLTLESNYNPSSSLNRGRIEEHYFTDNAYYYAVKRVASSRGFMLLWFDEGANSPVYIRSATKNSDGGFSATDAYGTPESNYYGILCYVDSRDEFIELISHWSGIYTYDNGRSTSYLYNTVDGYRTFEKLWNENSSQFTPKFENYALETWADPVKVYTRSYGGKQCEYYVNDDNACVRQWDGTERVWFTYDTCETFPFSKPERDKITWFSYYVMDGSYGGVSYDGGHFGMASKDWSEEKRKVTPRDAATGKAFSHWEKYDPWTWQWEYCSDQAIWTPSVTDVTTLRAIYKDVTYHIKVNGGYYQISTGWNKWSDEKYPEGDVKYGTTIKIDYDRSQVPEGKEVASIIDEATGKQPDSYEITVKANGEYTVTYQPETAYFSPQVENGVVKKDDEVFSGGWFPIGSTVTLTTEGDAGYTYFKGWCRVRDGSSKTYTVLSTDTTYTAKITKDDDSLQITAVWRATNAPLPEPQEPNWHNVTIVNGFVRSDNRGIAVSALRAQDDSYILVIRDPTLKRDVERWELTDADGDGAVLVQQDYQEYGNLFEISGASGGKYDGKYDGKGGKDPVPGGLPANILITGVLKEYCIHTCTTCGGCTSTSSTDTCGVTKCTCTAETAKPLQTIPTPTTPTGYLNDVLPTEIKVVAVEVDDIEANKDNPYVSYALQAAEGYKVDKIYDISLQGADGQKYTLNDNKTATITLTIGKENARLIDAGTLVLIHITDTGRVIYGKEETSGQKKFDKVDTENGTVTFTTDSCSPFVLARKAGVSVKGKVASYNGSHDFTVTLYAAGTDTVAATLTVLGNGLTEQEFTIPNVPKGTYDLVVTKDAHLKYTVKNVEVGNTDLDLTARTDKPFSTIKLLCGDVDGDRSINVTDLNKVWDAANFNKDVSSATNKLTDLNGDGNVNVTDLNILWDAANFNKGTDNCTFQFK